MANQVALLGAIKFFVDASKAVVAELKPGQTLAEHIADFQAVLPDVLAELAVITDLPAEFASMKISDISSMASALVADLDLQDTHATAIVVASLKVLNDIALENVPDVEALLKAIHT